MNKKKIFNAILYIAYRINIRIKFNHYNILIEKLRNELYRISSIPDCEKNSVIESEWLDNKKKLRANIINDNPLFFLNWNIIRKTMFVGNSSYILKELASLKESKSWNSRYKRAIDENIFGFPERFVGYYKSSGTLIHHLYSIYKFEEKTKKRIDDFNCIFEFGGGYGSMCRSIFNLGFNGIYIIYDIPEFSALQRYYLTSIGINVIKKTNTGNSGTGVMCISDFASLSTLLKKFHENSLFIGLWSVSEAPMALRKKLFGFLPVFSNYLIAYQKSFNNINNILYFKKFKKNIKVITWLEWEIKHLKNNYYLIGYKSQY
jgi:hypothetical protein